MELVSACTDQFWPIRMGMPEVSRDIHIAAEAIRIANRLTLFESFVVVWLSR